jgi:DNA repair exonuclease SbcCD nuclease subunit
MEFVGIGDLHLSSPGPKGNVGGLSAYIDNHDDVVADLVIKQPLRYAKEHGIEHVVLYGDLFEHPRASYEGQLALIRILRKPFQFHVIVGNHDMFGEDPSLGHSLQILKEFALPNVSIYTEPTIKSFGKARINFLPYPHNKFVKDAINIAHVDVAGARSDSGRLMDGEKMPSSKYLGVVGHIHTNQQVRNTHYSGTLYQTNFGESQEKFFHHCVYDVGEWEVNNIAVKPTYRLHTCEVAEKADLKSIPASKQDLIKLILLPGAKVEAADYAHLNVVRTRAVATEQDLNLARIEDLHDGAELEFSVDEFFENWLEQQPADKALKAKALKLRDEILRSKK